MTFQELKARANRALGDDLSFDERRAWWVEPKPELDGGEPFLLAVTSEGSRDRILELAERDGAARAKNR